MIPLWKVWVPIALVLLCWAITLFIYFANPTIITMESFVWTSVMAVITLYLGEQNLARRRRFERNNRYLEQL